jgi:ubiquinone/menaquinone biosynthesis C-methylase UbiE
VGADIIEHELAGTITAPQNTIARMNEADFWDALAPHHSAIENNYFDLPSLRHILRELQEPVLVVGAGQGLIVAELQNRGLQCDGVDFSPEMIRYAKLRRGLSLIQADAKAMPLKSSSYQTLIYATGVVDFTSDEADIKRILDEAKRIASPAGKIFVAFYRLSPALEHFLVRLGLLHNHALLQREALQIHRLGSLQMLRWVAKRAGIGRLHAALLLFRMSALSTLKEKMIAISMKKIFKQMDDAIASSLIDASPEKQPYRNEMEIGNLFKRLGISVKGLRPLKSCVIVQV